MATQCVWLVTSARRQVFVIAAYQRELSYMLVESLHCTAKEHDETCAREGLTHQVERGAHLLLCDSVDITTKHVPVAQLCLTR